MLGLVQHVLDPVGAVGNLQGDPLGLIVFHPAVPVGTEAEDVAIEMIFGLAMINKKTGVDHVARNRGSRWRRGDALAALHELDAMAFGIVHDEEQDCGRTVPESAEP